MPEQSSSGTAAGKSAAPRLSRERRHILQILASSGPLGITEAVVMAHGCSRAMLAGLACDGYVAVAVDTACIDHRATIVRRIRITDAGRKAIED
jgi:hypothetical protein